jgi:hypothetical protein
MMSRPFRNFFLLNLLLSNILLGVPSLWAGVVSAKTSAPLASYLALSAYFDKLASAASEDPRIEFFAVKESQDRPESTATCKKATAQWSVMAVNAWVGRVQVELNQNLEIPILMTKEAEIELSQWLSDESYTVCQKAVEDDLSTSEFLYLIPKTQKTTLTFEAGYEN